MAFIFKQSNSSYWYAGWKDENGKRVNRSTKLKNVQGNRRQAQKVADSFEEHSKQQRASRQVRDTILEFHHSITGKELPNASFREYSEQFLNQKKAESSDATVTHYKNVIKSFMVWKAEDVTDLNELTKQDMASYRNDMLGKVSSTTANKKMKGLRAIFAAAIRDGYMLEDPTRGMQFKRKKHGVDSHDRRIFTVDQLKLILTEAHGEWKSMILFGLYTGQRLGDLAQLRWSNIDIERKILRLETNKTSRLVTIPIAEPLFTHIMSLPVSDDPKASLHPELSKLYGKSKSATLSNQFTKILENVGLRKETSHESTGKGRNVRRADSKLSFHSLRATAVSLLHQAGIPAATVQEWVGHDSEEVHRVYVKVGEENLRKASEALPDI